jgi:hypothetical protein
MKKKEYLVRVSIQMQGVVIVLQKDGSLDIDNKMYIPLTSSSSYFSVFSLPTLRYMAADPGYDAKELYQYGKKTLRIDLVCPVERYKSASKKRLELVCFYESEVG